MILTTERIKEQAFQKACLQICTSDRVEFGVLDWAVILAGVLKPGFNKWPKREEMQMHIAVACPSFGRSHSIQTVPTAKQ